MKYVINFLIICGLIYQFIIKPYLDKKLEQAVCPIKVEIAGKSYCSHMGKIPIKNSKGCYLVDILFTSLDKEELEKFIRDNNDSGIIYYALVCNNKIIKMFTEEQIKKMEQNNTK